MRFILGIVVGVVLTVGVAYVGDTMLGSGKPLVNWDVVGSATGKITDFASGQWNKFIK
jgi:hypothetical protein